MPRLRRSREALLALTILFAFPAAKPMPHTAVIDPLGPEGRRMIAADALDTVPTWTRHFAIQGQDYHWRLVGRPPGSRATTSIPTIVVPIKLTVSGTMPVVFDATPIVPHILSSPLFAPSLANGNRQFSDAMLRAEFPKAPRSWHTILAPSVGPTLEVTAPQDAVKITQTQSGKPFGTIKDSALVNRAIGDYMHASPMPHAIMIFITYNSVESFAFGYHSWRWGDRTHSSALVYMYSSWLEDVDDALGFPSPDAATLSHEIVETIHDPLITSVTREWGDPFRGNRCFDTLIEVADAVEDAPLKLVYYKELGMRDDRPFLYTLQNTALLPWFTREAPSSARGGAYSFPSTKPLRKPAPLECVK